MSNGFTNLPTSLLGAVNIGGNLVVQGTTRSVGLLSSDASLQVGLTPNITRVGNFAGYGPGISGNLQLDAATRDNAGVSAALKALGANGNANKHRGITAAGVALDEAIQNVFGTSNVQIVNPANIAENILYTRAVPAGYLGANGGFGIEVDWDITASSTGTTTLRIKFGGTVVFSQGQLAAAHGLVMLRAFNVNAQNAQRWAGFSLLGAVAPAALNVTSAIDSSLAQNIDVAMIMTDAANAGRINWVRIHALESFGPV